MNTTIDAREKDIQTICKAILHVSPDYYDNPNGGYETTCPFCRTQEIRGGQDDIWASMSELSHTRDCAYLIAKDLSTGY